MRRDFLDVELRVDQAWRGVDRLACVNREELRDYESILRETRDTLNDILASIPVIRTKIA